MEEIIIALLKCKGIGNTKVCQYIIDNEFDENRIRTNLIKFIPEEEYKSFDLYLKEAKKEINTNLENGIEIITMLNKDFPSKLYYIKDPVVYLYYKGNIKLLNTASIGIIGSRKAKEESLFKAKNAGEYFASKGISVVSGLAIGIDVNAHIGTLKAKGKAIAVLPSDLLKIMPSTNKKIADEIVKNNGLLVSEYSIGHVIDKYCFAKRDRIQSALSDIILVIEANETSGTMIAVKKSISEGKRVYQLKTNRNTMIKNSIDLEKDGEFLTSLIQEEYNKNFESNNQQITLF